MGRGVPAHVHAEAILSALLEARPAGLAIVQLMAATERTRAQIPHRSRASAQGRRREGPAADHLGQDLGLPDAGRRTEIWIGYERAFFESTHHRIVYFIEGILLAHRKKRPDDPYIRTVMAQMGVIESTLHLLADLE
ncbi:hypothetical protein [Streptomyces sp. NPDC050528]|uniref:hypothetical protein n=1 Tax=Streptomyces sp. NPDC050528 TaxID=3365623 RepID=UPI0037A18866